MPANEQAFVAQPFASAGGRVIASPFQFVTSGEDNLRVVSANALTGVQIAIQGRRLDDRGALSAFTFTHTPNTDRSIAAETFPLGRGAILNAVVFASSGAPLVGQVYVMLQIVRGFGSGPIVLVGVLLAGFVTSSQSLAYPGSPLVSSLDIEPYVRVIAGTTPAAGAEVSETVPTGARWELLRFTARLNTPGAGRIPALLVKSGGVTDFESAMPQAFTAGAYSDFIWSPDVAAIYSSGQQVMTAPVPKGLLLLAGETISTNTIALAGTDTWTNVRYSVREWLEVI